MDFVTWGGRKVTNWGNSLPSNNGNGLMRGWTKQEKRESVIDSVSWNSKIVNQTTPKCAESYCNLNNCQVPPSSMVKINIDTSLEVDGG